LTAFGTRQSYANLKIEYWYVIEQLPPFAPLNAVSHCVRKSFNFVYVYIYIFYSPHYSGRQKIVCRIRHYFYVNLHGLYS